MGCEIRLTGGGFNFSQIALRASADVVAATLNAAYEAHHLLVELQPAEGDEPVYVNPLHVMVVLPT